MKGLPQRGLYFYFYELFKKLLRVDLLKHWYLMYYLQIRGRGSYLVKVLLNIAMSEERVEVLTRIENMFPDIEDELEDRHSSLYGKFKLNFRKEFTSTSHCYSRLLALILRECKGHQQTLLHSTHQLRHLLRPLKRRDARPLQIARFLASPNLLWQRH